MDEYRGAQHARAIGEREAAGLWKMTVRRLLRNVYAWRCVQVLLAAVWVVSTSCAAEQPGPGGQLYAVNGVKLYATLSGSGPPVVFLHGGLSYFDRTFAAQKDYFAGFRTVVGIDQRGNGHSPDNGRPFSYREMADDTAALIRKLKLARVDIVGHSDGGNVGLLLARYYPELVRRVVISGANSRGDFNGLEKYIEFEMTSDSSFVAGLAPELRSDYARVSPDGEQHWPTLVSKTKALWETWTVIATSDLAQITIPVLVMGGDHDAVSLEHTISIYRALPKGQLCIIPATGHETASERPDYFNRVTREFLEAPDPR